MEIWIILDGEKSGPIHDFEIRRKIEQGELPADTPAWHEGLAAWTSLVEIDLFRREFDRPFDHTPSSFEEDEASPAEPPPTPPPLPGQAALIRRFWARWFDLFLFAGIWWITMWAAGRDIQATLRNPWIILLLYIPWFVIESFLLHRFGSTPGKWLLGLKVTNDDGSLLSLSESTRRSVRVLLVGIGFGLEWLSLICQTMAFFTTKRLGRPLWDHAGGHRVTTRPLDPIRLTLFVILFFGSLQLQTIVVLPYNLEVIKKQFPEMKERIEKTEFWYLPKNSD